jgi:succinyl-diaminopimelate desuccinylase
MLKKAASLIDQVNLNSLTKVTSDLIKFRTESEHGNDFEQAANYLLRILDRMDFETQILGKTDRPILVGTWKNSRKGINFCLHGNYDVVPVGDPTDWEKDPFVPVLESGRLYGRGSVDMKGGLAVICEVARILTTDDANFQGNLFITLTSDGEIGSKYSFRLLKDSRILPRGKGSFGLVPECSGLDTIWNAAKGVLWYEVTILGKQAHGSLPSKGINAFEHMCELITSKLSSYKLQVESRKSEMKGEFPDSSYAVMNIGGFSSSGWNITTIPGTARFSIDRRLIPEEDIKKADEEIQTLMEEYSTQAGVLVEVNQLLRAPSGYLEEQHPLCQILSKSAESILSKSPQFGLCSGHFDIHLFNAYGIPMLAYGPGDLAKAHAPNEFVEIHQLEKLAKIYVLTCLELSR